MYFVGKINLSIVGLKHKVIIVDERCDPRVFLGISLVCGIFFYQLDATDTGISLDIGFVFLEKVNDVKRMGLRA